MKFNKLLIYYLFLPIFLFGQEKEKVFDECLIAPVYSKAKATDFIHYSIVEGSFKIPKEGNSPVYYPDSIKWKKVNSDSLGWFKMKDLRKGYAYFEINSETERIVQLEGSGHTVVYVNGVPRAGNKYQYKDRYESWEPKFNFSYIPIKLNKGKNQLLFYCPRGYLKVRTHEVNSKISLNTFDLTMPDVFVGEKFKDFGGIPIINNTEDKLENLSISAEINGKTVKTKIPNLNPLSVKKVRFNFAGKAPKKKQDLKIKLAIYQDGNKLTEDEITLRVLTKFDTYKETFISKLDGSVQYYAVTPSSSDGENQALFLSLHGANVEALNQAGSYYNKSWGNIVSPTNRRPYGYDWEFWGSDDALEVLEIAKNQFKPDEDRIYLTGHSMGGHGTWYVGATYPDKFAAIAPSAGWISLWTYAFGLEQKEYGYAEELLNRSMNPSNTYELAENYLQQGIFIIHGDSDKVVPVSQAIDMMDTLKKFHNDFDHHFEPGQGHWWDNSDENGAECVDWPPMFEFFARHSRPTKYRTNSINFTTASPGISASNNWITIYAQEKQFDFSNIKIKFEPGKKRFKAETENISILKIDCFKLSDDDKFSVEIDSTKLEDLSVPNDKILWLGKNNDNWNIIDQASLDKKHPKRYGSFKDAFGSDVVFVYGTDGSDEENNWSFQKARFDAEYMWYQGNSSIDVISDEEYLEGNYSGRNVIIYGNKSINEAWKVLLSNSPIQIENGRAVVGSKEIESENISSLFIRPIENTDNNLVGVVAASGQEGRKLLNRMLYFSPVKSYPDFLLFDKSFLKDKEKGIRATGYFDMNWKLKNADFYIDF